MSQYSMTKKYQSPSENYSISTFESFMEFYDIWMVQTRHCVDLLKEKFFKDWIFDHFLF